MKFRVNVQSFGHKNAEKLLSNAIAGGLTLPAIRVPHPRLNSTSALALVTKGERKRLDVALVGAPNAGKSQLLNVLVQSKVAAVSRKRHTTRDGILGARTIGDTQLVFVDTPGYLRTVSARKEGLMRDLMVTATSEMKTVDYTLLVVDAARKLTDDLREALISLMVNAMAAQGRVEVCSTDEDEGGNYRQMTKEKFAIVLNKVDLVHPKNNLLQIADELGTLAEACLLHIKQESFPKSDGTDFNLEEAFPTIFYISATGEDGTEELLQHLLKRATSCKEWPVHPNSTTQLSNLEQVEEVLREKLYRCLHREVPHSVQQVNRSFNEKFIEGRRVLSIDQDLVVRTKSHQRLVMGSGGKTLKRIHETAQRDLERCFGCAVILELHVKLTRSQHDRPLEG